MPHDAHNKAITKYLKQWAHTLPADVTNQLPATYQHCVVIPVYDEPLSAIKCLPHWPNTLVILVFNYPDNGNAKAIDQTQSVFNQITYQSTNNSEHQQYEWSIDHKNNSASVLAINTGPLPHKKGVGLARKIGFDWALFLYEKGILSQPWIHSSDADVSWPDDWLERSANQNKANQSQGALVYPFEHKSTAPESALATELYDCKLRYYVEGLTFTSSPWNFHTIGSTLAIHANAYASVRGFPQRSAGEDFHLLCKIGQHWTVASIEGAPLIIQGRPSTRVPFGTGPSIKKLSEELNPHSHPLFYHPNVFEHLRRFLQSFAAMTPTTKLCESLFTFWNIERWKHSLQADPTPANQRQFFDALKTLRTIHEIHRLLGLPRVSANTLLDHPPKWLSPNLTDRLIRSSIRETPHA